MGKRINLGSRILLILISLVFASPLIWLALSSIKPPNQIFLQPPKWIPNPATVDNYIQAVKAIPFFVYLKNTVIISVCSTIGVVLSSITPAYALSRMKFRGRGVLLSILLATMFLPYPAIMVPTYLIFAKLGWTGTFLPLIAPSFLGDAFSIFLLRQFFIRLPGELLDAGRVDGANDFQVIRYIVFPLSAPAIATVAVLNFTFMWSDFVRPLLYLNDSSLYTLSIGIQEYQSHHATSWHLVLAATVIFMLPIFLTFWAAQRTFISGLTLGSVKE
jgi:multiple sugar transport system permease protein